MKRVNLTGQVFGRLTVHERVERQSGKAHFRCVCECGSVLVVDACNLRSGHTPSCGCLRRDRCAALGASSKTHGHSKQPGGIRVPSRTYRTWRAMLGRCYDPKHPAFKTYGILGVCKAWRDSFAAFLQNMGERPEGRTLDRIDNRFGYFLANCRWATPKEQVANRRLKRVVA